MTNLGVDGIGEVNRSGALRKAHNIALGGKDIHLARVNLEAQRVQELAGIRFLLGPLVERLHPRKICAVRLNPPTDSIGVFLILPVGCYTILSTPVHLVSADLQLDRLAARPQHRGVQRLVHVVLGHRDVVLKPTRKRVPSHVHDTEGCVTIAWSVDKDAQTSEVVDVREIPAPYHHLLIDRVVMLRSSVDDGLDACFVKVLTNDCDDIFELGFPLRSPLRNHMDDLVVELRVKGGEAQVFQLPLDGIHPKAVS